jgi:hypothetical protein
LVFPKKKKPTTTSQPVCDDLYLFLAADAPSGATVSAATAAADAAIGDVLLSTERPPFTWRAFVSLEAAAALVEDCATLDDGDSANATDDAHDTGKDENQSCNDDAVALADPGFVSVRECRQFSETGLMAWGAGIYMMDLLAALPVAGMRCVELGSGTGISALGLLRGMQRGDAARGNRDPEGLVVAPPPHSVVVTDLDPRIVDNLARSVRANGFPCERVDDLGAAVAVLEREEEEEDEDKEEEGSAEPGAPRVVACPLDWASATEDELAALRADFVFGADLVYVPETMPWLARVLAGLLKCPPGTRASPPLCLIASAIRNETTYATFEAALAAHGLVSRDAGEYADLYQPYRADDARIDTHAGAPIRLVQVLHEIPQ